MKTLESYLSAELLEAMGWTVIHSIWQGMFIALFLLMIFYILGPLSSRLKYILSAAGLAGMLICSIITFINLYTLMSNFPADHALSEIPAYSYVLSSPANEKYHSNNVAQNITYEFSALLHSHIGLITILWFTGVLIFSLRFFGGLFYVQSILKHGSGVISKIWERKLQVLGNRLGIQKKIKIMESVMIETPMVIGHFKPVILFPVGMYTGLSVQQIEAVIAHELAHIQRNDWLVNLVQSVIETIFFFHPAAWWLSSKIKEEREKACDDIAIALTGDPLTYVKALTEIQEITHSVHTSFAMTFSKKKFLLSRIKRLMLSDHQENNLSPKLLILSIIALSVCAFTLVDKQELKINSQPQVIKAEVIPSPNQNNIAISDGIINVQDTSRWKVITDEEKEEGFKFEGNFDFEKEWDTSTWIDSLPDDFILSLPEIAPMPEFEEWHLLSPGAPKVFDLSELDEQLHFFEAFPPMPALANDHFDFTEFDHQSIIVLKKGDTLILNDNLAPLNDSSYNKIREELIEVRINTSELRQKYLEEYKEQIKAYQEEVQEHQEAIREIQQAHQQELQEYRNKLRAEKEILRSRRDEAHNERREEFRKGQKESWERMEIFEKELKEMLISDDLLDEGNSLDFNYDGNKDEIVVNGKKLNKKLKEKYKKLLENHNHQIDSGIFRFQMN